MGKHFTKSKTIIFNTVAALVYIATAVMQMIGQLQDLGMTNENIMTFYSVASIVVTLGNMILRFKTVEPVTFK